MNEQLADHIIGRLQKSKYKCINIDDVSTFLRKRLGDEYTSEIAIGVKQALIEHDEIDFFKEGTYNHDFRYYYCVGNWIACKGEYKNPIEAKIKMGMLSWQNSKDDESFID